MKPFQYAIIGGTGVYDSGVSSFQKTRGNGIWKVEVDISEVKKNSIVFLARHGKEHGTLPTA
ncbi:MAG: hypothetical protein Ct9H300mP21_10210 [Pseudomonadota bacterium]|nr:MAG: hypothetical protein Ct9H300mP21_10210 [Pseudomonadota bacterium]